MTTNLASALARGCPACGGPVWSLIDDFAPASVRCREHGAFLTDGRPYRRVNSWITADGRQVIALTPSKE